MQLIIAEKPSLGKAIAEGLGGSWSRQDGYLENGSRIITWVFGHILELADADEYNAAWKRWNLQDLPLRIERWKLKPTEPKQLGVIKKLLARATEVVHAGDPDREGQLLVDEVLHFLGWKGKTMRLLPHATDPQSIQKAWRAMKPNTEFVPLYEAALCRQRADWLVGINATRAATLAATEVRALVSVGRVMTPTLALVVRRDREIEAFESREYYKPTIVCELRNGQRIKLLYDPQEHIFDKAAAQAIARAMQGKEVRISREEVKKTERAPLPWHLGDFQRSMQKARGITIARALEVLQNLYEKKLASYPRTDCRYLPEEQKGAALPMADKLAPLVLEAQALQGWQAMRGDCAPKDYIYDNAKVAEHHGLVPTGLVGKDLDALHDFAWKALVQHFLRTLAPHHQYIETRLTCPGAQEGVVFGIKGMRSLNWHRSWRWLDEPKAQEQLPDVGDGVVRVVGVEVETGKTTPPARYTEATLVADMESVAKYAADERVKKLLKESSGIGTAATRASIIEKLKKLGMLQEVKTKGQAHIVSTSFGREVVDALPASITDAALTATWEDALQSIAQRSYEPGEFMRRIDAYVQKLVHNIANCPAQRRIRSAPQASHATAAKKQSSAKAGARSSAGRGAARATSKNASSVRKKGGRAQRDE